MESRSMHAGALAAIAIVGLSFLVPASASAAPLTPSIPDLATTTDSGISNTDNITFSGPVFLGTGEPGTRVRLYSGDTIIGTVTVAAGGTYATRIIPVPAEGVHQISADATDGSTVSDRSGTMTFILDQTAPTATFTYARSATTSGSIDARIILSETGAYVTNNSDSDTHTLGPDETFLFTFKDLAGNSGSALASSAGVDVTPPVIVLEGEATMTVLLGSEFVDPGAVVTDNEATSTILGSGSVDTSAAGTYALTYDATDEAGNHAVTVTRTVTVTLSEEPVASAPEPTPTTSSGGGGGSGRSRSRSGGGSSVAAASSASSVITDDQSTSASAGEVLGASTYGFSTDLSYGATGEDVNQLQLVLIAAGYLVVPAPTGWFGPMTVIAVQQYQAAHGIRTTGYVGPLTRGALNLGSVSTGTSGL